MSRLLRLEKYIFYTLVFLLFCQGRIILHSFGPAFNEWNSIYFYVSDILIIAVIFLWAARKIKDGSRNDSEKQLMSWKIILIAFLLISCLSLSVSNNFVLSFYGWLKIFQVILLFFYVAGNFSRLFSLERFWQVFVASAALQSVVAIVQFFKQHSLGLRYLESPLGPQIDGVAKITVEGEKLIRAYGLVPHPNILAAILILAIFGLAYLWINSFSQWRYWQKVIYASALGLIAVALFFTFSRVIALVGISLLIFWATVIFFRQKNYRRPILVFAGIIIAVFCLLAVIYWPQLAIRYDLGELSSEQALNLRIYYNKIALDLIGNSFILGVGQGNFVWTTSSLWLLPAWMYQPVHNIYLLIGAEIGILGLVFFIWFLFTLWRRAVKAKISPPANCFVYIFYFIIIVGLLDHFWWDLQQGQIMFWLFLGILASLISRPCSLTDKASPSGGEDCAFDSHQGRI